MTKYETREIIQSKAIFFTARRYASALYAMALCPCQFVSVRLSQVGVLSKRLNESSWFWAWELHANHHVLSYNSRIPLHGPDRNRPDKVRGLCWRPGSAPVGFV